MGAPPEIKQVFVIRKLKCLCPLPGLNAIIKWTSGVLGYTTLITQI